MYVRNSDYASGEYTAIDFGYNGTQNPVGRIGFQVTASGSRLSFGTSSNYSNGITNQPLTINYNGCVGIGTTTAAYTLDVDSTIHIGNDGGSGYTHSRLIFDSNGNGRGIGNFYHNQNTDLEWFAGNPYNDSDSFSITRQSTASHAESTANYTLGLFTIDGPTGNVGIGSTNPAGVLDLGLATNGRGIVWGGSASNAHYASIWTEYGSASLILGAGLKGGTSAATFINPYTGSYGYAAIELDSFSDDGIKFYCAPDSSRTINQTITPVECMRIRTGGDVLIGTTTQVYGSARLNIGSTSDTTNAIQIQTSTSGNGYLMFGDGTSANAYRGYIHYNHPGDYLRLRAAGSERLRCDSGGVNVYGDLVVDSELYFNTSLRVGLELTGTATATVGPGWMTVATNTSGRRHGEILVTDADSGDHGFIRIDWLRSYGDSNFTVLNCGGHSNRITGARVIREDSNNTYGTKLLQVYVTTSSTYDVALFHHHGGADYTQHTAITPVIENTKTGYSVQGAQIEELDDYSLASEEGVQAPAMKTQGIYSDGDSDNTYIQFHAANQFRIVTGGSERFEQNQGTTSIPGTLNVRSAIDLADNDILRLGSGDDVEFFCNGSHMYMDLNSGIGNFYIRDGTTTRYTFDDNGSFTATGNITAYSDRRVKRDFEPIENALEKVSQLEGMTYIRTDISDGNRRYAGLIAQDVEKVLPEAVSEVEDRKVLDYNGTIGLLVEAIKELKEEVASLKAKLKDK